MNILLYMLFLYHRAPTAGRIGICFSNVLLDFQNKCLFFLINIENYSNDFPPAERMGICFSHVLFDFQNKYPFLLRYRLLILDTSSFGLNIENHHNERLCL